MYVQLDTGLLREFGIQLKYLDRKRDFVGDALARRLHLHPQFQIFVRIVKAITVFVVNVLAFAKWAAQTLFHEFAVLVFFATSAQMKATISRRMHVSFGVYRAPLATFVSAFTRAESLAFIVARVFSVFGAAKAAFLSFAATLALKNWCWTTGATSLVHEQALMPRPLFVKEII